MKNKKLITGCVTALLTGTLVACAAPETYYDAGLGESGYYGTVPSLPGYTPQLWNVNPIVAIGAGLGLAAIYLNVPAYQRLNWGVYCSIYNACYRPVYFINNNWYRTVYAPAYLRRYGRPGPAFRPMGQPGGARPPANAPKPGPGAKPGPRPGSSSISTTSLKPGSIPGIRPSMQRPGATARPVPRPGGAVGATSGIATTAVRPGAKPAAGARPATGANRPGTPPSGARPAAPRPSGGARPASPPPRASGSGTAPLIGRGR